MARNGPHGFEYRIGLDPFFPQRSDELVALALMFRRIFQVLEFAVKLQKPAKHTRGKTSKVLKTLDLSRLRIIHFRYLCVKYCLC